MVICLADLNMMKALSLEALKRTTPTYGLDPPVDYDIKPLYDPEMDVLNRLEEIDIEVVRGERPRGIWFGESHYNRNTIQVYSPNISDDLITNPKGTCRREGFDRDVERKILDLLEFLDSFKFHEIINQSGMDHEVGHFYRYFTNKPHSEAEACKVQLNLARVRGMKDRQWGLIARLMPGILKHHKGVLLA